MRRGWSSRQRWWFLAAAWAALLVLGIWGFIRQSRALDTDVGFLDHLYFTLQLAALNYRASDEMVPWQLQIARFTAPVLAAGTLIQSASVVFREQFRRWRAHRAADHTIVVGLDGVGSRLVEASVAAGRRVVAVESDPASPGIATAAGLGVPVVLGDPTDIGVLRAARVDRARRLVAATPSDGTNVAIASAARSLPPRDGRPALRCSVRLTDGDLAHLLRSSELRSDNPVRVEFFNVHERAAHALLGAHPVPADGAHLMLVGLGQFGGAVLVTSAQRWAEHAGDRLTVTIVDRHASGRLNGLTMQHPAVATAVDALAIDLDTEAPAADAVALLDRRLHEQPPSLVIVAFEDESVAWSSGLFVRRRLERPVDIVVRTNSDGGLGQQLASAVDHDTRRGRILPFPVFANACTVDLIEGGVREQLARSIHEDFLARGTGGSFGRPWADLDDVARDSSRAAADAIIDRLASIGFELEPLRQWGTPTVVLTPEQVDVLAAAEHARWKAEREAGGWRWAPRATTARRRTRSWSTGPSCRRTPAPPTGDRPRPLPAMLARAGFEIARQHTTAG